VQGRLRREKLTFNIQTSCACCGQKLELTIDDQLHFQIAQADARPLVFAPDVDWATFDEPNIIHAY